MAANVMGMSPEQIASFRYQQEHISDDLRPVVYAVTWILWCWAVTATFLRFYAQRMVRSTIKPEDGFVVLGLLAGTGQAICNTIAGANGLGLHSISPKVNIVVVAKCAFAFQLLYGLTIVSIKYSILIFYHRAFYPYFYFRVAVWCVAGFVTCWIFTVTFGVTFQCTPISFVWNKSQPGHCIDFRSLSISTAIINIVTDCIIVVMPMPIIWRLQLPMSKKLGLSITIVLGGIVILASILRVTTVRGVNKYDFSYDGVVPGIWTVVEPMVGIVGVSLPLMTPLFRKIKGGSTQRSSEGGIEGGWYRARLGSGQRTANVPLANYDDWIDYDPTLPANRSLMIGTELQDPIPQCHFTGFKSRIAEPGAALPWRGIRVPASSLAQSLKTLPTRAESRDNGTQRRARAGKKRRIAMRKKHAAEVRAAETEKEKRARKNREKKLKKREKNRQVKELVAAAKESGEAPD
ncbi:hypothetical protein EPUS_00707 [Endocarpon pusillum Z07020]|uniref:Rhodopsin domain-containing protein n=1 Tax=Endocarpon pusillum (strain Z07020 / HMAS-L-300199) TaxID=1263415 RepID=U1GAN4_ENDPU|nr:uncharacterized protein EPUS_00707 [Endocarpon pusillum Z07020]ERF74577.1 hypothetical protein EPUS_00707 [Endocarpon pusillum Z07020]